MSDKAVLSSLLWDDIVAFYNQGAFTRVRMPYEDVTNVLIALAANVLSQVPDAAERNRILGEIQPRMSNMIETVRKRQHPYLHHNPSGLILPN